ncbi:ComEC/Rec2 family competence protein [Butyrivibrio sp. VCD2006]|uniref:ComEC/Rec2 family competence protein n=1 Tax=Butyrivibrio sp. VCD2006 TaxID=1280664 RepID=UPI000405D81D|nr:ComEC/Rec2 family competence protein [Butyrivibrio sp. VCD2006]
MKRPLCVVGGLLAAAVFFLLLVMQAEEDSYLPDQAAITITGKICGKEEKISSFSGEKQLILYLKTENGRKVMLYLDDTEYKLPMGCTLKASGKVRNFQRSTNPGEFDSQSYYRILKIEYSLTDVKIIGIGGKENKAEEFLYKTRLYLEGLLDKVLSPEDSGVMKAILLGDKNYLTDDIKEEFKRNGIIHIIAVSGMHISIIGMSLYKLLRKIGMRISLSAVIATAIMYSYGIMCGMSTSAFRAIMMFAVHLGADIIGRTYDMLSAMALSGIILLISCPLYLKHSGFLMSFGAVIALGYVLPAMPDVFRTGRLKLLGASISIMLVTLPVSMCFYYTYPIYSVVLNLFVLPLMSSLMLLGILSIAFAAFLFPAGFVIGRGCHLIIKWFILCCLAGSSLPGNTWYAGHAEIWQVIFYLIILAAFVFIKEKTHKHAPSPDPDERRRDTLREQRFDKIRYALLVLGLFVLCLRIRPDLRITVLDVGQGDGIVIETKKSRILIDGGSTSKKNVAKYQIVPFLSYEGIGDLDAVVLTHEDEDHMSGILEMMDMMEECRSNIRIRNLILPCIDNDSKGNNYRKLEKRAEELRIPISYMKQGDEINFDKEMLFKCIGPVSGMITNEPNAYSTILLLKYGGFSALFTGDVEGTGQDNLKDYIRHHSEEFENLTLLKVAHHGSEYTTDKEFLELIKPKISLISCGVNNRYGHPHRELLDRLEEIGTRVYRTDLGGAITISLDRNRLKINSYVD